MKTNRTLNATENLSQGQLDNINRVCLAYPELNDDDFVKMNLDNWFA